MFFGASGSIAGGQMNAGGQLVRVGHVFGPVEDRRVVARERGSRNSSTSRFGSDRSMWQRQTSAPAEPPK